MKKQHVILAILLSLVMLTTSCVHVFTKGGTDYRDAVDAYNQGDYPTATYRMFRAIEANPEFEDAIALLPGYYDDATNYYLERVVKNATTEDELVSNVNQYKYLIALNDAGASSGRPEVSYTDYSAELLTAQQAFYDLAYNEALENMKSLDRDSVSSAHQAFLSLKEVAPADQFPEIDAKIEEAWIAYYDILGREAWQNYKLGGREEAKLAYLDYKEIVENGPVERHGNIHTIMSNALIKATVTICIATHGDKYDEEAKALYNIIANYFESDMFIKTIAYDKYLENSGLEGQVSAMYGELYRGTANLIIEVKDLDYEFSRTSTMEDIPVEIDGHYIADSGAYLSSRGYTETGVLNYAIHTIDDSKEFHIEKDSLSFSEGNSFAFKYIGGEIYSDLDFGNGAQSYIALSSKPGTENQEIGLACGALRITVHNLILPSGFVFDNPADQRYDLSDLLVDKYKTFSTLCEEENFKKQWYSQATLIQSSDEHGESFRTIFDDDLSAEQSAQYLQTLGKTADILIKNMQEDEAQRAKDIKSKLTRQLALKIADVY